MFAVFGLRVFMAVCLSISCIKLLRYVLYIAVEVWNVVLSMRDTTLVVNTISDYGALEHCYIYPFKETIIIYSE